MTLKFGRNDGDGLGYVETTNRMDRNGDNLSNSACAACRSKKVCFAVLHYWSPLNICLFFEPSSIARDANPPSCSWDAAEKRQDVDDAGRAVANASTTT